MQSLGACSVAAVIASGLINEDAQKKWAQWHLDPSTVPMRGNAVSLYAHLGWNATPHEVVAAMIAYTPKGDKMKLSNTTQNRDSVISSDWVGKVCKLACLIQW